MRPRVEITGVETRSFRKSGKELSRVHKEQIFTLILLGVSTAMTVAALWAVSGADTRISALGTEVHAIETQVAEIQSTVIALELQGRILGTPFP